MRYLINITLIINFFLLFTSCRKNSDSWLKTFGGKGKELGHSVAQTIDGGYIIVGRTDSFGKGKDDIYIVKANQQGQEQWTKTYGGVKFDMGFSVQEISDGGYIIVGSTSSFGKGYYDVYLIKTDNSGNEIWSKTFGGKEDDWGFSVKETKDGGYIIAGCTSSFGAGKDDIYLIKTDAEGNEEWSNTHGGKDFDLGFSVEQTEDGGYIIVGWTSSFGEGKGDVYLIKTNKKGSKEWLKEIATRHDVKEQSYLNN